MTTIRRLYVYLMAFFGLALVSSACANLASLLLETWTGASAGLAESHVRGSVAGWGAAALVGLPTWLLHWLWTERRLSTDPTERISVLRRLYVYGVLACAMLIGAWSSRSVIGEMLSPLLQTRPANEPLADVLRILPFVLVALAVWLPHLRIAGRDRRVGGEAGGSATLRRWYVYGTAFIGLMLLLAGAQSLIETVWRLLTTSGSVRVGALAWPLASTVTGAVLWAGHWVWLAPHAERSTLRAVYLFLSLGVSVLAALLGASQLLYFALARLLGIDNPAGVGGSLLEAAAGPASVALAFGAGWLYQRLTIARQTDQHEGVERLYAYLVSLLSLMVWATAAAGLLWTLVDVLLDGGASNAWRDQLALVLTALMVGFPVWAGHWLPRAAARDEAGSLARRLYVYLVLIGSVLGLVTSLTAIVYTLLNVALGASLDRSALGDLGHFVSIALVAGAVGGYHARLGLRGTTTAPRQSAPNTASATA